MKNLTMKIVGTAAVLALSTPTFAQDNQKPFYGSIGYFFGSFEADLDDLRGDYTDGGTTNFTVDDVKDFDADVDAVMLRFGYQFHPNFSVEGRYGIGAGSDTGKSSISIADGAELEGTIYTDVTVDFEADVELDDLYGIFLRAGVSAGRFYPYAIIGYTEGEGETSKQRVTGTATTGGTPGSVTVEADITEDETESDFSYGIGTDFRFTDSLAMNAEWISYLDKDGAKIGGFQLGLVYSF